MESVRLANCNTSTIGTSEGSDLNALDGAEDIAIPIFGIQELDFAIISL